MIELEALEVWSIDDGARRARRAGMGRALHRVRRPGPCGVAGDCEVRSGAHGEGHLEYHQCRVTPRHKTIKQDAALAVGRGSFLGFPAHDALSQACQFVGQALDETCYLVGSVLETRDYRDVDVRVIMDDDKFIALFGRDPGLNAFWSLLSVSISEYLRRRTDLAVDFQIQRRSRVKDDDWAKRRGAARSLRGRPDATQVADGNGGH